MNMEITAEQRQAARKRVLSFLESNGIDYELYEHPALSSIEECLEYWGKIPDSTHCKNLFFRLRPYQRYESCFTGRGKSRNFRGCD